MQLHRLTHAARALAAAACILLALAASAGAMPADNGPPPSTTARTAAARPTVIRETVVRRDGGPGTLALVAIGVGAATARSSQPGTSAPASPPATAPSAPAEGAIMHPLRPPALILGLVVAASLAGATPASATIGQAVVVPAPST